MGGLVRGHHRPHRTPPPCQLKAAHPVWILDPTKLEARRVDLGITQAEVALRLGISKALMNQREGGATQARLTADMLHRLTVDRVLARWASDFQCSATDVVALLSNVGAEVAGAAQYLPEDEAPDEADPGSVELLSETDVARLLRAVRRDTTEWHAARTGGRWSLAGAQGKIVLHRDGRTGHWGEPSGATPTTHILKPAIGDMDDHDLNEHLCLKVAGGLGLNVARTSIDQFDDERALVVERYDRVAYDGRVLRVHQEDFCQALSIHPAKKYQNEGGPSVADMVKLVRDAEPGDPTRDVEAICRAVAYNWLILGTDAHAKNYSLLLSGAQVRLAPLYDIASAAPYDLHRSRYTLAQKVGGEYRPSFIARCHWDRLAADCGVNPEELIGDIHTLIDRIPDVLSDTIRDASLTEDEGTAAGRLLDAISEWLTVCNRSLDSGPDATTRPLAPPATSALVRHDNPLRLVADKLAARANIGPATGTRRCVGTYSNGKRCEHRAQPGSDYCGRKHGRS